MYHTTQTFNHGGSCDTYYNPIFYSELMESALEWANCSPRGGNWPTRFLNTSPEES